MREHGFEIGQVLSIGTQVADSFNASDDRVPDASPCLAEAFGSGCEVQLGTSNDRSATRRPALTVRTHEPGCTAASREAMAETLISLFFAESETTALRCVAWKHVAFLLHAGSPLVPKLELRNADPGSCASTTSRRAVPIPPVRSGASRICGPRQEPGTELRKNSVSGTALRADPGGSTRRWLQSC